MAITEDEWASIAALVNKTVADKGEPFTTGVVIKRDPDQRVIWTRDFGDEPIPIVDFNNSIRSFDTTPSGMAVRTLEGHADVPQIGDTVLVARELGTRRLPRCLGVIGNTAIIPSENATATVQPPSQVIPITNLQLPPRLQEYGSPITDLNAAVTSGWYRAANTAANAPAAVYGEIEVIAYDANNFMQLFYEVFGIRTWKRRWQSGWQAWVQIWPVQITTRIGHTFSVAGALVAGALPGFFIPVVAGQTVTVVGARAKILSGTSIAAQIARNGSNLGSAITVTTTAAATTLSQALANNDELGITLSAPTGSPVGLSFTLYLEHVA